MMKGGAWAVGSTVHLWKESGKDIVIKKIDLGWIEIRKLIIINI